MVIAETIMDLLLNKGCLWKRVRGEEKKVVLYLRKEKVEEMLILLTENFVDRLRQDLSICKFFFPHNPLFSF